jgi:hypothetical protein
MCPLISMCRFLPSKSVELELSGRVNLLTTKK